MIPSADPSNPQYSMIPQLTTQMSTLHLGTGSVSIDFSSTVQTQTSKDDSKIQTFKDYFNDIENLKECLYGLKRL